jgi:GH24 family phage-related lysozyme (muramidase)
MINKLNNLINFLRENSLNIEASQIVRLAVSRKHTVSKGDSVDSISRKYDVSSDEIIHINNLKYRIDPSGRKTDVINLQLGQVLELPKERVRLNVSYSPTGKLKEWMKYEEGGNGSRPSSYPGDCPVPKRGEPYTCSYKDGRGNWTIGWGRNQKSQTRQTITAKIAERLLEEDLADAAENIVGSIVSLDNTKITIPEALKDYQLDALTSLIFNAGRGGFKDSDLYKNYISLGKIGESYDGFKDAFMNARVGDDQGGLKGRREREFQMFSSGIYNNKK